MLTKARGLSKEPLPQTASFTKIYEPKDGYLLSARGKSFGQCCKRWK